MFNIKESRNRYKCFQTLAIYTNASKHLKCKFVALQTNPLVNGVGRAQSSAWGKKNESPI
jgi:hypothetical protein